MIRSTAGVIPRPRTSGWEITALLGLGVVSAIGVAFGPRLHIPGHAILYAMIPAAAGLAMIRGRFSGSVVGVGAAASAATLVIGWGAHVGAGSFASLILSGPILDLAIARFPRGGAALVLAGLVANLAAFAARALPKLLHFDHAVGRPLGSWITTAIGTYALCGALAGALAALLWRARRA